MTPYNLGKRIIIFANGVQNKIFKTKQIKKLLKTQ